ncbi:hypothetical protein [Gordonia westfalica]|uniref:Uncharacterized protein n=1 Tax=Gordonia westfalica TaxID=158898 RepID=A0A1H2HZ63_9ACTN|nr:hypothetical protein [Gordonia westfalica]SDU36985.1 hypothetical protein SAMN04488548_134758 [Gordonia westfalica]
MWGNRGPWWVQTLVSAAILVAFAAALVASLHTMESAGTGSWVRYGASAVVPFVFLLITAAWARSGVRLALVLLVGLILLALERVAILPFYLDSSVIADWDARALDTAAMANIALFDSGAVIVWSIARRRTPATWLGVIPAAGVLALGTWAIHFHQPDFGVDLTSGGTLPLGYFAGVVAFEMAFILVAVLILWAFDGIGLTMRRGASTVPPQGPPADDFGATQLYRTQAHQTDQRETERYRPPPPPLGNRPPARPEDPSFRTTQIRRPDDRR